jgi:tRNA A-37 threonylcarbamoyl transferase component Bud32
MVEQNQLEHCRTLDYVDITAQIALWQKALFMVPLWAFIVVPLVGFACNYLGGAATQLGLAVILSICACYFFQDLLKRKIRVDDQNIFFGFTAVAINDIASVNVSYKKNKFLPDSLVLQRASGRGLKLKLSALKDEDVEYLLKHLQARNSELKTASVLTALVRCRTLTQKDSLDRTNVLSIPYRSRQIVSESAEAFKAAALKWMRVGPLVAFVFAGPFWLGCVSGLYSCLHPHLWHQLRSLKLHESLTNLLVGFNELIFDSIGHASGSMQHFAATPAVVTATSVFLVALFVYMRVLFKPNRLVADGQALRLVLQVGNFAIPLRQISWSQIQSASLHRLPGRAGSTAMKIRFVKTDGCNFDINLASISDEHRSVLLKRVEKNCPSVKVESELAQVLQPKSDRSYTELWLQSLTQAPQRRTLDPLQPGQLVGDNKFEVLKPLGIGGQGTAYLCRVIAPDAGESETVVLKETVLPTFVDHEVRRKALERFETEARLLKNLNSEGVVKLLDYFVEDHRSYLVLEYIEGSTLRELVQRDGALGSEAVTDLALQMCNLLKLLHKNAVVHRDFTPDNLILNSDGKLKLIDFNVAQQVQSGSTATIVGKHAYLPPEQFRGKPTTQSDLYAMGATVFFLLTGKDPEPISQSSPRKFNGSVDEGLDAIVKRATALSTTSRYSTADDIETDLLIISDGDQVVSTKVAEKEVVHNG